MIVLSHHPHIRNRMRTSRVAFTAALAWLPLTAAACALWPLSFPLALGASAAVALAVPLLLGRGRISPAAAGWCLADAALLALLMPAGAPWHVPALLMAAVAGLRALLRNRGFTPPLNYIAAVMAASLLLAGPAAPALGASALEAYGRGAFYFQSGYGPLALTLLAVLLQGRWFKWPSLLAFLLTAGGCVAGVAALAGQAFDPQLMAPLLCTAAVAGIGLVADQRSSPLSRWGQAWAGAVAGCVFALFALRGLAYQGMIVAALIANLLTPLLDYLDGAPARPVIAED
jgi:Na+-translocating ferredoxin:NAD+ oxidoreductase RnfD subunit